MVWTLVYAAWGIPKPHNMPNMCGSWLNEIPKEYKPLVLLGATTLCWSVWLCRNAVVFDNKKKFLFAGYLLNYALAPYLGNPSEACFAEQACSGFSFLGIGGQGLFLPGHMGGGLVLGLTVISVEGYISKSV